jgi:hypothetical protein
VRGAAFLLLVALLQEKPAAFEAKGKLVCLVEEMKEKYKADGAPIHDHQLAFRIEGKLPDGGFRYYTILRNAMSEALYSDARFKEKELRLTGRVFPGSLVVEVSRFQWYKDGKLFDVHYWCSVCAIKGVDPGPCACCQGKVELKESEVQEEKK